MNMDKINKIEKLNRHRIYFKDFSSKRKLLDHVVEVVDGQFQKINELIDALQDEPEDGLRNRCAKNGHIKMGGKCDCEAGAKTIYHDDIVNFKRGYNQAIDDAFDLFIRVRDKIEQLKKNNK